MRHSFILRFITITGTIFGAALMGCGGGSGGAPGYTTGSDTNGSGTNSPIENGSGTGASGFDLCPTCGSSSNVPGGGGTTEGAGGSTSSGQGGSSSGQGQGGTSSTQGGSNGGGDCAAVCATISACTNGKTTAEECMASCPTTPAACLSCVASIGNDCKKLAGCESACTVQGQGGSSGTGGTGGSSGTGGTGGTSGGGDCNSFCQQAVSCGLVQESQCSQLCGGGGNVSAECSACAQAAGSDCNKLQQCGSLCTSGSGGTGGTGGSSGGTNCTTLIECCNPSFAAQCQSIASMGNDANCKAAATSLCSSSQGGGGTGGTSGGGGCSKLAGCCGNLPDPTSQMQCDQVAASGMDATCNQVLANPQFQMYCP